MNFRATTNPDHLAFYVSAIDRSGKPRIAAGPYGSHDAALSRLPAVRDHIIDQKPETHWWHWGTCSAPEPLPINIPLGAM